MAAQLVKEKCPSCDYISAPRAMKMHISKKHGLTAS